MASPVQRNGIGSADISVCPVTDFFECPLDPRVGVFATLKQFHRRPPEWCLDVRDERPAPISVIADFDQVSVCGVIGGESMCGHHAAL